MRRHPGLGASLLERIRFLGRHKNSCSRIFSFVATFTAITTDRPCSDGRLCSEAGVWGVEATGFLFDPKVVEAFRETPSLA